MGRAVWAAALVVALGACGGGELSSHGSSGSASGGSGSGSGSGSGTGTGGTTATNGPTGGSGGTSGGNLCDSQRCVVYASADHDLYQIDPQTLEQEHLCAFGGDLSGSSADVVTDLAVSAQGTVYAITLTKLYTVDPASCAATRVATLSQAGTRWVGLTFTASGELLGADGSGAVAQIDPASGQVTAAGSFRNGLACSGDLVAINDAQGSIYATATDGSGGNDLLVKLDPGSHVASVVGDVGYRSVFGLGFWAGKLYAFTHAGATLEIDPATGAATSIGTTSPAVSFSGGATTPLAPVFQ
jgi:hypothetical protein